MKKIFFSIFCLFCIFYNHLFGIKAIERFIKTDVVDGVIQYQYKCVYSKADFDKINKNVMSENLINHFKNFINNYKEGDYKFSVENMNVSFDEETGSVDFSADVKGAIKKNLEGRNRATLLWLIKPLRLDFIDDKFIESENGLSWNGVINNIDTSINLRFPPQDEIYKAWSGTIGHCHGHVWWIDQKVK